ncbi:alcohol dehydrogenase catalytic domain-containing protein [Streptosporangium sp. NBC_01755]|uniref:zinc-dependent alcohol dehydrogenase n=1 Tax=unclassified Streptosporangium TaxID=2632669 RepID=UPI002DD7BC5D|nr:MULTISPECIES: alcohol dehydrogenase catalytic domain-containing protein [unclassified Streptosporangium]WSA29708.1 alcohol dehydrogenase catalytic domain-containing protein [Streptosporangium sp. NBC_01810]WSD04151.1 alcohol dehydrogenase catalytic domain-containing protein [Streptosporangium sp. NBC_01755]
MRQVWINGPELVEVREVPIPRPEAGEVLVRMAYAGICGSDLHTLRRGHPWLPYPIAPGHEASGVVAEAGPGTAGLAVGDAVYLRPSLHCGQCFYCRRGRENLCANLVGIGSHRPGAFADYFAVPYAALAPVPTGVSLRAAAMTEPLATAVHAVGLAAGRGGRLDGCTVAVLGGGTIGQCVLLAALDAGAGAVAVTDPVAGKRALATRLGAVAALDAADPALEAGLAGVLGGRPDVVFDCVATAGSLGVAISLSSRGGSVIVVGVGHGPLEVAIEAIQDQEIRIAGSAMYVPDDFTAAERLIAAGAPVDRLVTSVCLVGDAPDALRTAATGTEVKIHISGPAAG